VARHRMHQQQSRGVPRQRLLDHLPRIHRGLRHGSAKHLHVVQDPMLRIQMHQAEHFVLEPTQPQAQEIAHHLRRRQHVAAAHTTQQQALRSLQHLIGFGRTVRARNLANEKRCRDRGFERRKGRNEIVRHGRLRASGGIARDRRPARRSAVVTGSETAAGRQRAQHVPTLTASTPWHPEGNSKPPAPSPAHRQAQRAGGVAAGVREGSSPRGARRRRWLDAQARRARRHRQHALTSLGPGIEQATNRSEEPPSMERLFS
jgi:hypothetical protein